MKISKERLLELAVVYLGADQEVAQSENGLALIVEEQLDHLDSLGYLVEVGQVINPVEEYYRVRIFDKEGNKVAFFRDDEEDVATLCAILKVDNDFKIEYLPWDWK